MQLGLSALYRLYETADGWLCLACVDDAQWAGLGPAIGRPELARDPLFTTAAAPCDLRRCVGAHPRDGVRAATGGRVARAPRRPRCAGRGVHQRVRRRAGRPGRRPVRHPGAASPARRPASASTHARSSGRSGSPTPRSTSSSRRASRQKLPRDVVAGRDPVVGIGQTEFSKSSGRSELQLTAEATLAALDDAGLTTADVDGMVTFTIDPTEDNDLMRTLGIPALGYSGRVPHGGGAAAGTILHAASAIAAGAAEVVVCYRALNAAVRSSLRPGARDHRGAGARHRVEPHQLDVAVRRDVADGHAVVEPAPVHGGARLHEPRLRRVLRRHPRLHGRATRTRGSTRSPSPSTTTRAHGGSSSPCCDSSTAARRATAASRSS